MELLRRVGVAATSHKLVFAVVTFVALILRAAVVYAADDPSSSGSADGGAGAAEPQTPSSAPETSPDADASAPAAPTPTPEPEPDGTPPKKPSDIVGHASVEIGAYQDSVAVSVLTPSIAARIENPIAGWGVNGRYLVDVVSAASPDIVSTASPHWVEIRNAGNLGAKYKPGNFGVSGGVFTSYTPDYLSLGANGQLIEDLDDKNLTLTQGYGFNHDVIGRKNTPFAIFNRQLDVHAFSLGASRIVNPSLVVGLSGDFLVERGDQSKPYRYIPIFSPADAAQVERGASVESIAQKRLQAKPLEQLPLERNRLAISGRVAWRLSSSTIRVEERFYADTWGLKASTTDGRWLFDITDRLTLWPHLRVHVQNGVDFWQRAYASNGVHDIPALRTSDRELGPLQTLGLGAGMRLALGKRGVSSTIDDWALTTSLDGAYTSFADTIYVKERLSGLFVTGLEVAF